MESGRVRQISKICFFMLFILSDAPLKRPAAEAGARTASIDTLLIEELKVYSQQQGLGPLEVD